MVRMFVSAGVVLLFTAGLAMAADKPITGKVKKIDGNKITLSVGKKGMEEEKEFTIGEDVKFVFVMGDEKKELTAKEGLKAETFKVGANVSIKLEGDKVVGVQITQKKPK